MQGLEGYDAGCSALLKPDRSLAGTVAAGKCLFDEQLLPHDESFPCLPDLKKLPLEWIRALCAVWQAHGGVCQLGGQQSSLGRLLAVSSDMTLATGAVVI